MDTGVPEARIDLVVVRTADLAHVRAEIHRLAESALVAAGDAVLVANELVTNALQYTPGPCRLRGWITTTGGGLRGEVSDPVPLPLPPTAPARPSAARGRGLVIVDQLVSRWGVDLRPPDVKVVWFEIDPER